MEVSQSALVLEGVTYRYEEADRDAVGRIPGGFELSDDAFDRRLVSGHG